MHWVSHLSKLCFAGLLFSSCATGLLAEIIYTNPTDFTVSGEWTPVGDDILLEPAEAMIEINTDGSTDLRLNHEFRLRPNRLSNDSFELLSTAVNAMYESHDVLLDLRTLTISAASEGLLNADEYARQMARVANRLDRITHIAENTRYADRSLLNGDAGISGTPSSDNLIFLNATDDTFEGAVTVDVTYGGERATLLSEGVQTNDLAQDETLTINGVSVELFENMAQTEVRDRINQFTSSTGVTASIVQGGPNAGRFRLTADRYGAAAEVQVISNTARNTADSTTFYDVLYQSSGSDVVVEIAGVQFNGQGDVVTADSGVARGLSLQIAADTGDNSFRTLSGDLGVVLINDNALQFALHPDANDFVRVALPNLRADALGIGVTGNQFQHLAGISISSASRAQDSLAIIDASISELRFALAETESILDSYYYPFGVLTIEGENAAELMTDESGVVIRLTAGDSIDAAGEFGAGPFVVNEETFGGTTTGYFGVRLLVDEEYRYGWLRGSLGADNELTIHDYAFESTRGDSIRAGFVPEPIGLALPFVLATHAVSQLRRKKGHDGR